MCKYIHTYKRFWQAEEWLRISMGSEVFFGERSDKNENERYHSDVDFHELHSVHVVEIGGVRLFNKEGVGPVRWGINVPDCPER
ncbi:hypothetical protein M413DRAFT_245159 [Hebeloma cylindrosporum]|uniref:Uncharacterized protein n=1 Tax=Hebeloma cylindrosporum TaxID=76867 RepID=A0A0C3C256_HEBCY|nr:hypothetical protein M413DRAFT_245159 [Hebeloma cylindrosporum h7]